MYIVLAILLLEVIIIIHELGHFLVGRLMGITVLSFSVGFGPKLFGWKRGDTEYALRLIPIGGYCKFLGEDEDEHREGSMLSVKPWRRFLTIAAGPLANFLLAAIMMTVFMSINGNMIPVVTKIESYSLADENGLQTGDIIRKINGKDVISFFEVSEKLASAGSPTKLTVSRNSQSLELSIPRVEYEGSSRLGIVYTTQREPVSLLQSANIGMRWLVYMTKSMYQMLGNLITGKAAEGTLVGPVGTIGFMAQQAQGGMLNIILLVAVLSLNLSVFNLIPFPALDGSRLVFLIYEMVRKKPFPPEKEGWIHAVGMALLLALMAFLTFKDVRNLFL